MYVIFCDVIYGYIIIELCNIWWNTNTKYLRQELVAGLSTDDIKDSSQHELSHY